MHIGTDPEIFDLRLLVDHLPSMLGYWDTAQRCRFANRAYVTWFGADPGQLVGRHIRELLGPELYALNLPHILGALRGEVQRFERIVPGPDGISRYSLAHYLPHVEHGAVLGFMVQVTEVTQLREAEAALRRERALREALEASQTRLTALLAERDETLDVLAHEVRQPLHNASAALRNVECLVAPESQAHVRLRRAQAVLSRVGSAIDNTLAIATSLARFPSNARQDIDIDALLALVIGDAPAEDRPRICVQRLDSSRTAWMDLRLMRLALRNVLANALGHGAPDGTVVLRVSDGEDDPLSLCIDVVDRGNGFGLDTVPRLFERGAGGNTPVPGHGLGLYLVRRLMRMQGGRVDLFANRPGEVVMRLTLVEHDWGPATQPRT